MTATCRCIAVTGATGYIGQALVHRALEQGIGVVALARRPLFDARIAFVPYDLTAAAPPPEVLVGIDAVIHLAANTRGESELGVADELAAARALIAAASSSGARFVFVSSQAARADAPTDYGRCKWIIQQEVLAAGGVVVSPGLVYGGRERALFGTLCGLVRALPALPDFRPAPKVQPVHVDDLAEALLRAAATPELRGLALRIADTDPVDFAGFLRAVARYRVRKVRMFMPIPRSAIRALRTLLGARLGARLGLERLESLFELRVMETAPDLQRLGLVLRRLDVGLARGSNGARRLMIEESRALLTYVLRAPPPSSLVRRYVRALERLRDGRPMGLPRLALRWTGLVALLEGVGARATELEWRLNAAVTLAEASPVGARRFLSAGAPMGFARAGFTLALSVLREAGWRVATLGLAPLLRRGQSAP